MNRDEITKAIEEYFTADARDFDSQADKVRVTWEDNTCSIRANAMYTLKGLSFADMQWVSNLLKTEKINVVDDWYIDGCESCDYGSDMGWELECKEVGV